MSLSLNQGTVPEGVTVHTYGSPIDDRVHIDVHDAGKIAVGLEVTLDDFLAAAWYVLTNTDLEEGDPRVGFRDAVAAMAVGPGHNPGGSRLVASRTAAFAAHHGDGDSVVGDKAQGSSDPERGQG